VLSTGKLSHGEYSCTGIVTLLSMTVAKIQRFPRYLIHRQNEKSHRRRQKQNLAQFTACGIIKCLTMNGDGDPLLVITTLILHLSSTRVLAVVFLSYVLYRQSVRVNRVTSACQSACNLRLNVRKYAFSNRVIDNWNLLPASCIKCSTINTFKKHLSSELESEAVKFKVCQL